MRRPSLAWAATLGLAALMLCAVAIGNGGPIVYPDSLAYLIDAERMSRLAAPYATRPVFYGVAVWLLHGGASFGSRCSPRRSCWRTCSGSRCARSTRDSR